MTRTSWSASTHPSRSASGPSTSSSTTSSVPRPRSSRTSRSSRSTTSSACRRLSRSRVPGGGLLPPPGPSASALRLEAELERWHAEQLLLLRVDPLDPREGVVQVKADLGDVLRGTLRGSHFVTELVDQRMLDPRTVQVDRRAEM